MNSPYMTVQEVADFFQVKKSKAYQIIRKLNKELEEKGKIVIAGKIHKKYIDERI